MARMEILTGRERRRVWPDEQKLKILEEVARSGLGVAEIARRHDVMPQQIYGWRRQFLAQAAANDQGHAPLLLPVTLVAGESDEHGPVRPERAMAGERSKGIARPARIEIRCKGGRVLKVEAGLDPTVLRALIRSVEEA